jgi:hypothetical protein
MSPSSLQAWPQMLATVAAMIFAVERMIHFWKRGARSELFAIPLLLASLVAVTFAALGSQALLLPRLLAAVASTACGVSAGMYLSDFGRE